MHGPSPILQPHTCDSRVCCGLKLSLSDQLLAWGYRHILDLQGEKLMRCGPRKPLQAPALSSPAVPYLGLLEEWGSLFILDVGDLALLYLGRGS